jgi:UDP-N-acetylmuramyl pentapeptide phosphotransferase/UDP-N-acetylglucosamine-1-phosphate transferase
VSLALTILLAACVAAIATRLAIPWLQCYGAVAHENARTMHRGAVPKGGGALLLAAAGLAVFAAPTEMPAGDIGYVVLAGTLILAAVSWRDDVGHVPAWIRLPIHIAIALWFVLALPQEARVFQGWLPFAADRAIAAIALAWMMNLYNFMDGINAITGAETISISIGYVLIALLATHTLPFTPLAAALIGASAGFLVWNARTKPLVFLGDTGSVPLGFLMGVLMLDLAVRGYWAAALILPAYYFADASLTLLRRIANGERPWEAHKTHAYQRAGETLGHLPVVARIVAANAVLIAAASLSLAQPLSAMLVAGLTVTILLANLKTAAQPRSSDSDPSRP